MNFEEKSRSVVDAWDLKHWGRKPIADSSFQYSVREDSIKQYAQALRSAFEAGAEQMRERAVTSVDSLAHIYRDVERLPEGCLYLGSQVIKLRDDIRALPLSPEEPKS